MLQSKFKIYWVLAWWLVMCLRLLLQSSKTFSIICIHNLLWLSAIFFDVWHVKLRSHLLTIFQDSCLMTCIVFATSSTIVQDVLDDLHLQSSLTIYNLLWRLTCKAALSPPYNVPRLLPNVLKFISTFLREDLKSNNSLRLFCSSWSAPEVPAIHSFYVV